MSNTETAKGAEEMAKAVVVQYGEPTGPPLLATKDAVDKEEFFDEPQLTIEVGEARSKIDYITKFISSISPIVSFFVNY